MHCTFPLFFSRKPLSFLRIPRRTSSLSRLLRLERFSKGSKLLHLTVNLSSFRGIFGLPDIPRSLFIRKKKEIATHTISFINTKYANKVNKNRCYFISSHLYNINLFCKYYNLISLYCLEYLYYNIHKSLLWINKRLVSLYRS